MFDDLCIFFFANLLGWTWLNIQKNATETMETQLSKMCFSFRSFHEFKWAQQIKTHVTHVSSIPIPSHTHVFHVCFQYVFIIQQGVFHASFFTAASVDSSAEMKGKHRLKLCKHLQKPSGYKIRYDVSIGVRKTTRDIQGSILFIQTRTYGHMKTIWFHRTPASAASKCFIMVSYAFLSRNGNFDLRGSCTHNQQNKTNW